MSKLDQKQLKDQTELGRVETGTGGKKTITIPPTTAYGSLQINCPSSIETWHGITFHQPWNTKSANWTLMCNANIQTEVSFFDFFGWFNVGLGTWSFYCGNGFFTAKGYQVASDQTKKKDIALLPSMLTKFKQIKPISYKWQDDKPQDAPYFGFAAQEIQQQFPEVVKHAIDSSLVIDTHQIVAILWKATQELALQVSDLQARVGI